MNQKILNLVILVSISIIGGIVFIQTRANYLASLVLFIIIPAIFLSFLFPKHIKKAALFSLSLLGGAFAVDGIVTVNNAISVQTMFPFKLLGLFPIEDMIFAFFSIYLIVLLYEYVFNSRLYKNAWHPRMNILTSISFSAMFLFLLLYYLKPNLLAVPFVYLWIFVLTLLIPFIIQLIRNPKTIQKYLIISVCCLPIALFYEIVALKAGIWSFPGNEYVWIISMFGVRFPFEEFFFFMFLFPAAVLAYYDPFDNEKQID